MSKEGATEPAAVVVRARILAIDDEVFIGAMLQRTLADAHDVEVMSDPELALARIAGGERFDIVLCDMTMPGKSGIDVYEAITRLSPSQSARMIFLTGGAINPRARDFLATPGRRVVAKPFSVAELLAQIDGSLIAFPPPSRR